MFGTSSELAPNMFGASSEPASVMEFGFYRTRPIMCFTFAANFSQYYHSRYWQRGLLDRRAVARSLFVHNGQELLLTLPLFASKLIFFLPFHIELIRITMHAS